MSGPAVSARPEHLAGPGIPAGGVHRAADRSPGPPGGGEEGYDGGLRHPDHSASAQIKAAS